MPRISRESVAQELFDAGFKPVQEYKHTLNAVEVYEDTFWLPPTTDVLIDACGDHFGMLQRKVNRHPWLATPKNGDTALVTPGYSAWEALSKFWLGLRYAQLV